MLDVGERERERERERSGRRDVGPHRVRGANSIEMRDREYGMREKQQPHLRIDKSMEGKRGARTGN